jgi:hypothetical protein
LKGSLKWTIVICAITAGPAALAQPMQPSEAIAARCQVSAGDLEVCEARQRAAMDEFMPIVDFITEGEYVAQMLALGRCLEATKDRYGQDYEKLPTCYDDAMKSSCGENQTCLSNSSIAGIKTHIHEGTRP